MIVDLKLDHPTDVLIVDDDPDIRAFVRGGLTAFGCSCVEASDVPSARERAGENSFGLVLLDISMPGEKGDALLAELAPVAPDVVVVMMSAEDNIDIAVQYLRSGAYDYMKKPFSLTYLRQVVSAVLDRRRLEIENREYRLGLERMVEEQTEAFRATMEDLLQTRQGLIHGLCGLAEFRDDETGRHLERMSEYVRLVARKLAEDPRHAETLTPPFIDALYEAAPLHDIGKVGIPDSILRKPDRLTADEFDRMKRHAMIGADAIRLVMDRVGGSTGLLLELAREVCQSHHERWDGAGYPARLDHGSVPLSAQIVSVADIYDAMTFPRVYRPYGIPHDEVVRMIVGARGKDLAPDVVDAFLAVADEARKIAETMGES